jgi:hypothetical protein
LSLHPVYVISKGRARQALTARFLKRDGVPFRLVVEPQEAAEYRREVGGEIVELPFSNLGQGSRPARNWCWEDSIARGAERHWILDDNIGQVRRLYSGRRIPSESGPAFAAVETFVERYENVAIAGMNYQMFVTPTSPPYRTNVHVYSCLLIRNDLEQRWRLRYNEDVDLCLQVLTKGFCTVLVNAFMVDKKTTMTMRGGNTDELYAGDGRLRMARSLEEVWPGIVSVDRRWGRAQHVVDWSRFRTPLVPREGVDLDSLPRVDELGLTLRAVREPEAPALRRIFDEYHERRAA